MEKLAQKFSKTIILDLKKSLQKKNIFEVPCLEKVVISAGIGDFKEDDKVVAKIREDLGKIVALRPKINKSRKAVSAFKLRIGQPVGLTATLRGERMFDFIDKLINVALPRVRDFRGLPLSAFDGHGGYTIGIKDHTIFPEVKYEDVTVNFGFQINIKTTAKNSEDTKALLYSLGFPFEKKEVKAVKQSIPHEELASEEKE